MPTGRVSTGCAQKNEILAEIYRLLVIHFGEPPTEFEWRYPVKKSEDSWAQDEADSQTAENRQLTPPERHTPQSFYHQYVRRPLSEFVCLYNDPHNELDRHYSFDRARNIVGNKCMHFVNVATSASTASRSALKSSLLSNG